MSYNSATEIEYAITAKTAQKLFTDGGIYSSAAFVQALARASAYLNAALSTAGYSVPVVTASLSADSLNLLKSLEAAVFVRWNFPRKGVAITAEWKELIDNVLPGIVSGTIPIDGLTPNVGTAVGGATWSSSTANQASGTTAPVFSRQDSNGKDPLAGF